MTLINELNADIKTRDEIIFGEYDPSKYTFGMRQFRDMTGETLRKLIDKKFANPEWRHNDSPEIKDMLDFITKHPDYTVYGYAIIDTRDDYRISIEGMYKNEKETNIDTLREFVKMNRLADEFDIDGPMYCWYD